MALPINETFDDNNRLQGQAKDLSDLTRVQLSQAAHETAMQSSAYQPLSRDTLLWGGGSLVGGAAVWGLGEYAAMRAAEPAARVLGAVGFGMLGGGRFMGEMLYAPRLPWHSLVSPRNMTIAGAATSLLVMGGMEAYKWWNSSRSSDSGNLYG